MRIITFSAIDEYIANQLREKRLKRGMNLKEAASKIGVCFQQIQKYEKCQSKISAVNLYKLAKLYEIGIEKFFEGFVDNNGEEFNSKENVSTSLTVNLLIVEDNPADEALIKRALQNFSNLNIICVHDGKQVFDVLKYKTLYADFPKPNIIFLDIFMPKRDGLSVLKEIKRDEELRDIPVIIFTNNISEEITNKAYKLGASGYIAKSFDFTSFEEDIKECIKYWTKIVNLPNRKSERQ